MGGSIALPQELIEEIIDGLADERDALRACSLTSRRWLHRSRYHLHKVLELRHRNFHIHPTKRAHKAAALLDLPVVLAYAKTVHIRGEASNLCFHRAETGDDASAKELFWDILAQLSHVRNVQVSELYCSDVPTDDMLRFCRHLAGATSLMLSDCEFREPSELQLLLAACPHLQILKLRWIFWAHNAGHQRPGSPSYPDLSPRRRSLELPPVSLEGLRHLQVGYCARKMDESITEIFMFAKSTLSNMTLSLGPTDLDIEMLPSWVEVMGSSLEQLRLSFGQIACSQVAQKVSGSLEQCHKLRHLVLCAKPWSSAVPAFANPHFWPCSLEILQGAVNLKTLETVEFVWTSSDASFREDTMEVPERMDEILATRDCSLWPIEVTLTVRTSDGRTTRKNHCSKPKNQLRRVSAGKVIYPMR